MTLDLICDFSNNIILVLIFTKLEINILLFGGGRLAIARQRNLSYSF